MGVELKSRISVDLPDGGTVEVAEEAITTNIEVELTCDGSLCDGGPCKLSWSQKQVGQDPNGLPEEAFRVLTLEDFGGVKKVFGGKNCLRHYLKSLQPLQSPKERDEKVVSIKKVVDK